jgi:hypothetical protein
MADSSRAIDVADVLAVDAAIQSASGAAGYGLLPSGFVPKPFARLLAEKLALMQKLCGAEVDITSGSAVRKTCEVSALEDARLWAAIASTYDNCFVASAAGDALSRLGLELGLQRPFIESSGSIKLKLTGKLPTAIKQIALPRGARLSTPGGHHVALDETVVLSDANKERDVAVVAFYPGPAHNLNPATLDPSGQFLQRIDRFNRIDALLQDLVHAETLAGEKLVTIEHTKPLTGGELRWPDARYRELLLRAPRSVWSVASIETLVSQVPGVRQAVVRDPIGGLDINQSIFGNFSFLERLFSTERDLASPYYFTVLVAPTPAAIWEGSDGLRAAVESAIEDVRPIGIYSQVIQAEEIGVAIRAQLVVDGIPLPSGGRQKVNDSAAAAAFKRRLADRVGRYIDGLKFGEPIRTSEVVWAMMNEPGLADVLNLQLVRFPPGFVGVAFSQGVPAAAQALSNYENLRLQAQQIASFIDDVSGLEIV